MKQNATPWIVLALMAGLSSNVSANSEIRSHGGPITFVLSKGAKPISVALGSNNLGIPLKVHCASDAGCIISVHGVVQLTDVSGAQLCSFVDQIATFPACAFSDVGGSVTTLVHFLASATVPKGEHTVQSVVTSVNPGGDIDYWEIQYEVFEIAQKPN